MKNNLNELSQSICLDFIDRSIMLDSAIATFIAPHCKILHKLDRTREAG